MNPNLFSRGLPRLGSVGSPLTVVQEHRFWSGSEVVGTNLTNNHPLAQLILFRKVVEVTREDVSVLHWLDRSDLSPRLPRTYKEWRGVKVSIIGNKTIITLPARNFPSVSFAQRYLSRALNAPVECTQLWGKDPRIRCRAHTLVNIPRFIRWLRGD